jgi:hypothetical protein
VRVHLAREHAAELELGDALFEQGGIALELGEAVRVLFGLDEIQQLGRVRHSLAYRIQFGHHAFEARALSAEFLGALRRVPDLRVLQFAVYFLEPLALVVVLKGTPSAR